MATTVDSFHTGSSVLSIVRVLNFSLPSLPCFTVTNGSLLPKKRVEIELDNLLDFFFFWLSLYKQLWDQISLPSPLNGQLWDHLSPLPPQWTVECSGTTPHLTFLVHFSQLPPIYVLSLVYNNAERFHPKGASLFSWYTFYFLSLFNRKSPQFFFCLWVCNVLSSLSLWEIIQSKMNWNTKFSVACEQALYLGERSDPRVSLRLTLARVLFTMPLRWRACSQSQIPCYLQACFLTVYIFCYQTASLINVNLNTSSFCQKSTNNFFELVYKNFTSLDLLNYQGKRFF